MALEKLAALIGSVAGLISAVVQAAKLGIHLRDRKKQQEQENEKAAPKSSTD